MKLSWLDKLLLYFARRLGLYAAMISKPKYPGSYSCVFAVALFPHLLGEGNCTHTFDRYSRKWKPYVPKPGTDKELFGNYTIDEVSFKYSHEFDKDYNDYGL